MSRYTSITPDGPRRDARGDRRALDRGAVRPPDPRGRAPAPSAGAPRRQSESRTCSRTCASSPQRNISAEDELSFLGAGMYDHYVPALIDMLMERSEFLTPYTPYQPEISQGGLQVMFEYQTAISELTGLPVANASVYEGPSAVAAAGLPGEAAQRRQALRRERRAAPALDRDAAHPGARLRHGGRRSSAPRRRHRPRRLGGGDRRRVQRGDLRPAELLRRRRGRGRSERRREGAGQSGRNCPGRPDHARDPRAAGRVRRRRGRRRGPAARQPARLRRAVVRVLRRRARSTCAGCPGGSPGRPRTSTAAAGSC